VNLLRQIVGLLDEFGQTKPIQLGAVFQSEPQVRTALRKVAYQQRVKGLFPERRRSRLGHARKAGAK
jgi:hypothetical protein